MTLVGAVHEFAVGGAGGAQLVATLLQLLTKVDHGLFQVDDALFERVDVVGRTEAGLAPGLLAKDL
jgi:hypothetical protein